MLTKFSGHVFFRATRRQKQVVYKDLRSIHNKVYLLLIRGKLPVYEFLSSHVSRKVKTKFLIWMF